MVQSAALTLSDIEDAAQRIAPHAVITPTLTSSQLNQHIRAHISLKSECLQRTGSFKFRGALNRLLQIPAAARARGVVAWSSGNHAQGIALAGQLCGIHTTIVMPADAPAIKLKRTRAYGAEVVTYDRAQESREVIARDIVDRTGAVLVPSYDDLAVIAGQGTVGLELLQQCQPGPPDAILIPCGGGGLTAGIASAVCAMSPSTRIHTVEPENFDDHARSFAAGERQHIHAHQTSICDALLAPTPGELTFSINRARVASGFTVSDSQVGEAMRFAFEHMKLVIEPGGAVALAYLLANPDAFAGAHVGIVLSGGNVDAAQFGQIITSPEYPK